ncbi:MAG: exo-alpha-sialidase [Armatimonadetes bacterium]|nr:exo-alpha-sialidase [Armatimonadota bacterium]MDE2206159.1 exo-alpha-sialidase [Armatimonadota bacterium]
MPLLFAVLVALLPQPDGLQSQLIFPLQRLHNHASCVVQCPNGDLLCCWYRGSGEREADDVRIMGARLHAGSQRWSAPFVMADTAGFPDTNPCMIIDPGGRLHLFWNIILDHHWEHALLQQEWSDDYQQRSGPPKWQWQQNVLTRPGPRFQAAVAAHLDAQWAPYRAAADARDKARIDTYLAEHHAMAGNMLSRRLGWMGRAHPFVANRKRLIVPLYSDGFDFSMMAISDDWGLTWHNSEPLVGPGGVQPAIAERKDGTLVAFMRDNGPPPQRIQMSESKDDGETWTLPRDISLPNPGSGLDVVVLKSGRWLLVGNDTQESRRRLAVWVSDDEGRTWPVMRHIENDTRATGAGSYSYPSIIQERDGQIDVTYSYAPGIDQATGKPAGESIKHVRLTEAWLLQKHEP